MAIMVSVPAGITANQQATQGITESYKTTISNMQAEINETTTLIEVQSSSGRNFEFRTPPNTSPGTPPSGDMPSFGSRTVSYINETVVDDVSSIDGVKDVVQFLEASSEETIEETMNGPGGRNFTIERAVYTITGVSLNSSLIGNYSILPTNITEGDPLEGGDSGVVILTSNLSDYLGVGVGDKVAIYGENFEVKGIYEPSGSVSMGTRALYMNITDAQTITSNTGNVSRLDLYAENASTVSDIADVIKVAYSDLTVTTYSDRLANLEDMQEGYTTSLSSAQSMLSQTQTTATQEVIIAVVATSLIVLFMMLYTVRERTKEIGTFKAIGFSNLNVMTQFLLEGVLLSLMAGVVGIAIGYVAAPTLTSLLLPSGNLFGGSSSGRSPPTGSSMFGVTTGAVTLTPELILLAFGAAVLLGAVGSLYPAWRAAKIKPAEAMRYE